VETKHQGNDGIQNKERKMINKNNNIMGTEARTSNRKGKAFIIRDEEFLWEM
jgi:hypothetical protein